MKNLSPKGRPYFEKFVREEVANAPVQENAENISTGSERGVVQSDEEGRGTGGISDNESGSGDSTETGAAGIRNAGRHGGRGRKERTAGSIDDYHITDQNRFGEGGAKQKFRDNVAAIELIESIGAREATVIAVKPGTIQSIERKHGREKTERFLREYNISGSLEALTEGEARYVLSFSSIDALRARCLEEGYSGVLPEIQGPFQTLGVEDSLSFSKSLPAITRENLSLAFPGAYVAPQAADGNFNVRLPNGAEISSNRKNEGRPNQFRDDIKRTGGKSVPGSEIRKKPLRRKRNSICQLHFRQYCKAPRKRSDFPYYSTTGTTGGWICPDILRAGTKSPKTFNRVLKNCA